MGTPVCILHVEDSAVERKLVVDLLDHEMGEVDLVHADSRGSIQTRLAEREFDLVLSDFHLPGIEGLEILALVQAKDSDLPVVFMSSTATEEMAVEALKRGAADYVLKNPVHLQRLPFAIRAALEKGRLLKERQHASTLLRKRAAQQAAVAALCRFALTGAEIKAVMDRAVESVARTLNVEFAKVLELLPDGRVLLLRAGVGWREGLVGQATVPSESGSQAGYTLSVRRAVVVKDLRTERRFSGPPLLLEHGVVSGMSVLIEGEKGPFGVLGVHTRKPREFLRDEVRFLEVVADVLAAAIKRKRTEAELGAERDLLQALMDNIPDTIYFKDAKSRFTRINQAQAHVLGLPTAAAAIGKTDADFFNAEHAQAAHADEERIIASGASVVDKTERLRRSDVGGWRWFSATKVPLRDATGQIIGTMGVSRDITERVEAQERLREQAILLDAATDAILVGEIGGEILFWNHGAARLYGWAAGEAIGRKVNELLFRENGETFAEAKKLLLEQEAWQGELVQVNKAGTQVIVQSRWTLIRDSDGRPKSVLMINTDITEKKKLETQFLRTQRLECLGVLAGGVAHDLNNALAPVGMAADLLQPSLPSEEARRLLKIVTDGTDRAGQMVKQILAFSRGLGGTRMYLQVEHLIRDLKRIALDTFPKNVTIRQGVAKDLWPVSGDPTQLHQVLVNLCLNARDAMPRGGCLTIRAEKAQLDE